MPDFSSLAVMGSDLQVTMSNPVEPNHQFSDASTTTRQFDPLHIYFTAAQHHTTYALQILLQDPPPVGSVVTAALKVPGLEAQERAIELLGQLSARTLQFARQYADNEFLFRPVYANKVWEIVISALGMSSETYAPFSREFVSRLLHNRNPVKRLAAFDAMEALEE